jgi:hypothetical protein
VEKALAKQFGCAAFLPKPFDSHDLLDVVASFIKTRTS